MVATLSLVSAGLHAQAAEPPVKIIFDSDVDQDCDDIGALLTATADFESVTVNQ